MLENLYIKNLALVPELSIDFAPGLNIVTGETGAGKSLIIGAVQLLAGGRATPGIIRKGAKSCEVTGIVNLANTGLQGEIDAMLEEGGIEPCEENRLLIRRVITESGSRAYLNGSSVTAGFLKDLCASLVDIHGPHDNQTLLLPATQLKLLDTYSNLQHDVAEIGGLFESLSAIRREREKLKAEGLTPEESELLAFQLKEIDHAALQPGEEDELVQKYRRSSHSKRLIELAYSAQNALCGDEGSILSQMAAQLRQLRELEQLDAGKGAELVAQLEAISESIRDIGYDIGEYAESLDVDGEELERISRRLDVIQKMRRKYGPSVEDVLACGERLRSRLERIRNMDGLLHELAEKEQTAKRELLEKCAALHEKRMAAAKRLEKEIVAKLRSLGFAKSEFSIMLKGVEPCQTGADSVEYMFSANAGEDLQPLRQVASSGEIARVMLAIKAVLSQADKVPILIFDEIDANVGGRVAGCVAQELKRVGESHQVFSITHLPQIAASGDTHYLVEKHQEGERTQTSMVRLEGKKRLDEIVRMLGAEPGEATAVAHAKDLLKKGFGK